jgi:hypothetical protein
MHVRSTVISEPVRSSGFRYGLLGKTTTDRGGGKEGAKTMEGEIKGLVARGA